MTYQMVGHNIVFYLLRYQIKREVKIMIMQNTIQSPFSIFTFRNTQLHSGELKWENEEEFKYQDKMFDIIKTQKDGGTTTFYCLNDKKEELLIKNFIFASLKNNAQSNCTTPSAIQLLKFLGHYFLVSAFNKILSPFYRGISYDLYSFKIENPFLTIYSPPPQYC